MLVPNLQQFFRRQVRQGFGRCGLAQAATAEYVGDVLARFAHTPALYLIRDGDGRPIEHVAGLLLERWAALGGPERTANRGREALVVRHIGEYALFMSGLFRLRLAARGQLGYYLAHGRGAYRECAAREANPAQARVFQEMSRDFARIAQALDHLRSRQWPLPAAAASPLQACWRS